MSIEGRGGDASEHRCLSLPCLFRSVATRLSRALGRTQPDEPPPSAPQMASADAEIIRRFAAGEQDLREQAVAIHRRLIATLGARGTPKQRFMAEFDHHVPDLRLREICREALLKQKAA